MDELTLEQKKEYEALVTKAIAAGQTPEVAGAKSLEELRAEFPAEPPKKSEPKNLMDMSLAELEGLSAKKLRALCKAEEMTTDGVKEDFFNRLYAKRFGKTKRYIGQETCCQFCGEKIRVKGNAKAPQDDGRVLVTRSVKCVGRHHHIYSISQFEGKK